MTPISRKLLLKAKKYLDNGFNDKQTAGIVGIAVSTVAKVRRGDYGSMPVFKSDPDLKRHLGKLNTEQMYHTLNLVNKRRKKKSVEIEQRPEILNKTRK